MPLFLIFSSFSSLFFFYFFFFFISFSFFFSHSIFPFPSYLSRCTLATSCSSATLSPNSLASRRHRWCHRQLHSGHEALPLASMSAIQPSLPSPSPQCLPRGIPWGLHPHPSSDRSLSMLCLLPLPSSSLRFPSLPLFSFSSLPSTPLVPSTALRPPHYNPVWPRILPRDPDDPKPLSSLLPSPPPLTSLWSRGYLRHNW